MPRRFDEKKPLSLPKKLPIGLAFLLCVSLAAAQNKLGELLDAGAKAMSAEEFKREVVQRTVVGATPIGGNFEVMYTSNGFVQGTGSYRQSTSATAWQSAISGQWKIEDGRVCTSMEIGGAPATPPVYLPPRCQFWFKHDQQYFLSDSDSDRDARVLRRTLKP
jgi:hypothetical protein